MTLFFPDVNVWLALSVAGHIHEAPAWRWANSLPANSRLIFSWYTQLGLFRLTTAQAVMGDQALTLGKAWSVYDRWLKDPRVAFYPEPRNLDKAFRQATAPFARKPATKSVGDCYLLAWAVQTGAVLVTFDQALHGHALKQKQQSVIPA